jgi:cytochrome bd-type quinol oxidase subunit 2
MNGKNIKKDEQQDEMVFSWANYKWMLIGVVIIILGFVLMAGGGSDDPNVFSAEEIFSWRRISLAPFVVLVGFGVVGYSIFHRKRDEK